MHQYITFFSFNHTKSDQVNGTNCAWLKTKAKWSAYRKCIHWLSLATKGNFYSGRMSKTRKAKQKKVTSHSRSCVWNLSKCSSNMILLALESKTFCRDTYEQKQLWSQVHWSSSQGLVLLITKTTELRKEFKWTVWNCSAVLGVLLYR